VFDPAVYVGVPLLLVAVSILACWWPARAAGRTDVMVALRTE
jgi:ABC-type lipoprotein release transport system permease subunit